MTLPQPLQNYLDAWNGADAERLLQTFSADATIVDNGNRITDLVAWCQHQARAARAGAREVFSEPIRGRCGKSVIVHYILTKPNGGQVRGVDHFFLNGRGQIRMLVWTTRP